MRLLCFLFLTAFVAAIAAFAYFNQEPTTVRFLDWSFTSSFATIAVVIYLVGMLSGWTMLRMVRRSANSLADTLEGQLVRRR